jgi:hypothetical protein
MNPTRANLRCGSGAVVCSWSSPDSQAKRVRRQEETPLIVLSKFPEPALIYLLMLVRARQDLKWLVFFVRPLLEERDILPRDQICFLELLQFRWRSSPTQQYP